MIYRRYASLFFLVGVDGEEVSRHMCPQQVLGITLVLQVGHCRLL